MATRKTTKKPAKKAPAKKVGAKAGRRVAAKAAPAKSERVDARKRRGAVYPSVSRDSYLSSQQIMEDWQTHPGKDAHDISGILDFYRDHMERLRPEVESGSGEAMIEALEMAGFLMGSEKLPLWFAYALSDAVRRYASMEVRTLDEAFRLKSRRNFSAMSRKVQYGKRAYLDVCCLHAVGIGISNDMYAEIAVTYPKGIGRDKIKSFYEEEMKRRGGVRYSGTVRSPNQLPQRLHSVYEKMTGKRINK